MISLPLGAKIGSFDRQKLAELHAKLADYCFYFGSGDLRDPEYFVNQFLSKETVVIELPYGIVMVRNLMPGVRAEVHISCFDHKLSAHTDDLMECLVWGFLTFDLHRIETFVHDFAPAVRRFLEERLHFRHEGVMRERSKVRGEWRDIHVYGLLRDEALGG